MSDSEIRPPVPPFTEETARQKVQAAEDAWNTRDPERVALAYTEDSEWRNRDEFFQGRDAIVEFLRRKWAASSTTGCARSSGASPATASRCASSTSRTTRTASGGAATATSTGSSTSSGLMRRRDASINDYRIDESERRIHVSRPETGARGGDALPVLLDRDAHA